MKNNQLRPTIKKINLVTTKTMTRAIWKSKSNANWLISQRLMKKTKKKPLIIFKVFLSQCISPLGT